VLNQATAELGYFETVGQAVVKNSLLVHRSHLCHTGETAER